MILTAIFTILGLSLFETVSSVDNAIINAEVLTTMSARARRWFLTWGILIAVFVVRGILPFIIVWAFNPSLSVSQILSAAWSSDPIVEESIHKSAPILLVAGGVFLLCADSQLQFQAPAIEKRHRTEAANQRGYCLYRGHDAFPAKRPERYRPVADY